LARTYKGKESKPLIVLESVADYEVFLWHAPSYGYTNTCNDNTIVSLDGTFHEVFLWHAPSHGYTDTRNDNTILSLSPFMERFLDGTFHEVEEEAGVISCEIMDEEFTKIYSLVDGIFTSYSSFIRGINEPATSKEKNYTSWQEEARKDLERAFGVLENTWQFLD
jgi:hypothetical protein